MISVTKLTKTYVSKDGKSVQALKNVSFNLPDKGLIFITGKSGSGKSTLLNLLGGLDSVTRGDIVADGNRFSKFTPQDYDKYRNSYLGFVFQDYCLLEDLTVKQNIELVLDLNQDKDTGYIKLLLDQVHLPKYEDRYPKELSGGQKQRVAIARALAKDPQLILADEPTGNLDSKTAGQIMKLLKNLSKTKLVVVVSHNIEDAETYGDRIIELSDGVIIRDEQKMIGYEDTLDNINGKLVLPHHKDLTPEELKTMRKWLKTGDINDVDQRHNGFYPTANEEIKSNKITKTEESKLSFSKSLSLSWTFLKKRRLGFIVTSLIVTCVFVLLGLCQFFTQFDYKNAIDVAIKAEGQSIITADVGQRLGDNAIINSTLIYEVPDDAVTALEQKYPASILKLYNENIEISGSSKLLRQEMRLNNATNLSNFYLLETYGTIVCDNAYLLSTFGNNGSLQYIGDLLDKPYGIIITDYMADALIYYNPLIYSTREDVLGYIYSSDTNYNMYVNAILTTDYSTKYSDFKKSLMLEYASKISQGKSSEITHTTKFENFVDDVTKVLGVAYSINPDFDKAVVAKEAKNYTYIDYSYVNSTSLATDHYIANLIGYLSSNNPYENIGLTSGQMCMSTGLYNKIFGTMFNELNLSSFTPVKITLDKYSRFASSKSLPEISKSFTITKLFAEKNNAVILNEQDFVSFREVESYCYSLFFTDSSAMDKVYGVAEDNNIYINSKAYNSVKTIISIVDIFQDFFVILNVGLCITCILLLANFGAGNIRRRKYEIGVIKAMGGRTNEVGKIFIIQLIFIGLIVCLLSTILLGIFTPCVDGVLVNAMLYFVENPSLQAISIIKFSPVIMIIDIVLMLVITIVSAIVPLVKLHKIKPVNIIKHRN